MGAHRHHARYCRLGGLILLVPGATVVFDGMFTFSERSRRTVLVVIVLMFSIVGKWANVFHLPKLPLRSMARSLSVSAAFGRCWRSSCACSLLLRGPGSFSFCGAHFQITRLSVGVDSHRGVRRHAHFQ